MVCMYLDTYFKYLPISWLFFSIDSENLAICSKDAQFLKYYNLIKDLPDEFYKKIQKCEIPRCHTNRYNSFDFLDTVTASNDTIFETTHNFKIRASEVCKHLLITEYCVRTKTNHSEIRYVFYDFF